MIHKELWESIHLLEIRGSVVYGFFPLIEMQLAALKV